MNRELELCPTCGNRPEYLDPVPGSYGKLKVYHCPPCGISGAGEHREADAKASWNWTARRIPTKLELDVAQQDFEAGG